MKKIRNSKITALVLAGALGLGMIVTPTMSTLAEEQPPDMPSGEAGGEAGGGQAPDDGGGGAGGGADTQTYDYSGTLSGALTADGESVDSDGETVSADTADENAALAQNGGTLNITDGTLSKSGDDTDGDNCNFYGINSILLSVGSDSAAHISNSTLTADSEGSNGIFATDSGTVYAENDTISTSAGNSRGLDATYGGTIIADNMDITTQGDHSASIATDRGGGDISVTDSTLSTAGSGSPLLYSTGNVQVDGVTGTATGSQIAGMEGLNTILIYNSDLTSTVTDKTASDPIADGVIIYQSTSGDAETTTGDAARFEAVDSTLSSSIASGAMFYVTNTQADILLSGTTLDFDSDNAELINIAGNDSNNWGTAGSNGGTVAFTMRDEDVSGDIDVDTISSLDLYLLDGTTYTGAAKITENANGSTSDSPITVNIGSDSKWVVTGDSTISNLNMEDGAQIVDEDGNTVTVVVNGTEQISGDSQYTVTVTGSYSDTVSTDEDNELTEDYIDRTAFDEYYDTETTFGQTSAETESVQADTSAASETVSTVETESTADEDSGSHVARNIVIGTVCAVIVALLIIIPIVTRKKKQS